jgi:hypothetical protein
MRNQHYSDENGGGRKPRRKPHLLVPALIIGVGTFVTFVHDYAYRRVGGLDYELGGLISHAGTDMLVTTFACAVIAFTYLLTVRER